MNLTDAMIDACRKIEIEQPREAAPGRWVKCPVVGKHRSNQSGRVLVFDDQTGGIAWNWATGERAMFRADGQLSVTERKEARQDADRRKRQRATEYADAAEASERIVRACRHEPHPYFAAKGFPEEMGLVIDDPAEHLPKSDFGWRIKMALPKEAGPLLVVPGRVGKQVVTVQFITADGDKKNILGGRMDGASHRIATGRETWVCEGIATALTIRTALRILGRSATVFSAFSASNVAKVASGISQAKIAADNDKPIKTLGDVGTGEYYAASAGRFWTMPPERGDFNDMHISAGLRAVAVHLKREAPPI